MTRLFGLLVLATLVNVSSALAVANTNGAVIVGNGGNGGNNGGTTPVVPVPEPSLMALLAAGGAYAVVRARRMRG